jgi:mono/diheme cytochrome c family protein
MQAGADIYSAQCAACHDMSGEGIQRMFPTLKGSPAVQSASPMSLLHVVLEGTRAVQTEHAPTAPAMPAFEWKLTDAQVAAVTTYVRNSWGNAGSAVTSGDVSDARKSLQTGGS